MGRPLLVAFLALPLAAAAADPEPLVRLGSDRFRQAGYLRAIAYAPNGKVLVTADDPSIGIHLWDTTDGRRLHTLRVPDRAAVALWIGNDGTVLAAGHTSDRRTRFLRLDPAAGKVRTDVLASDSWAQGRFSPNGKWLTLRDEGDRRVRVIDTVTGKQVWTETDEEVRYEVLAIRPDSRVLAVGRTVLTAGQRDGRYRLYDLPTGKVLQEYAIDGGIENMAFSPDGKDLVAEITNPNRVVRFEAGTGKARWTSNVARAKELAFTVDGKAVYFFGYGPSPGEPPEWHWLDAETGKQAGRTMKAGYGDRFAVRPDGKVLAIGGGRGHVSQWDLTTRTRLEGASADPPGDVTDLRFNADGSQLRGWSQGWYEWDVKTGRQTRLGPKLDGWTPDLTAVSDDLRWLARVSGVGERFELLDLKAGRRTKSDFQPQSCYEIRFSAGGRLLVLDAGGLTRLDPATGKRVMRIDAPRQATDLAVSDDGSTAVTVTWAGDHVHVVRLNPENGARVGEWDGKPVAAVSRVGTGSDPQLSDDGRHLGISVPDADDDQIVRHQSVFDTRTGRRLCEWAVGKTPPQLSFSPDGRAIACCTSPEIEVREVATGRVRTRQHGGPSFESCRFSPDGRTLALATQPGPVALWDLVGKPTKWDAVKADDLWAALASDDAERAFDAVRHLRHHPAEAVAFLKERLKVPTVPAADWLAGRIKDLDAAQFRDRERATADLAAVGEVIVPELRAALKSAPAEARRRIDGLLEHAGTPSAETWRAVRACEALEGIGTPAAREMLAAWARGPAGATLTREAGESAGRLAKRGR